MPIQLSEPSHPTQPDAGRSGVGASVVPLAPRIAVTFAVALATALWVYWGYVRNPGYQSDFGQVLFAARAIVAGQNPYPLVGPGRVVDQPWPLYYPPVAAIVGLPFVVLPDVPARVCFAFCVSASFTFLLLRHGYRRLPAVMSAAYLQAMSLLQWSPLMACAVMAPALGWLVAAKPNIGVAVVAAARDRGTLRTYALGVTAALLVSFALVPSWLTDWLHAVRSAPHVRAYVARPGGALLLLALLRWRRPEARYLMALAVVPTTVGPADALVLFAFPHTYKQGLVLALLTYVAYFYAATRPPTPDFAATIAAGAGATLAFVFLPALAAILLRPNEGAAPAWLERLIRPLPAFLRGAA